MLQHFSGKNFIHLEILNFSDFSSRHAIVIARFFQYFSPLTFRYTFKTFFRAACEALINARLFFRKA